MPPITRAQKKVGNDAKVVSTSMKQKKSSLTVVSTRETPESSTFNQIVKSDVAVKSKCSIQPLARPTFDIEDVVLTNFQRYRRDFAKIMEMRKGNNAPVDAIGCHMLADKKEDVQVQHFQTLVALLLSPRVKDSQTALAMTKLKQHGLTVANIIDTPVEKIKELIAFIGLAQTKAERLKSCAAILREKFEDNVPDNYNELIGLPGVGDKIASLVMVSCFDSREFIGVDTHVHRISNLLKWVKTKSPQETDAALKKLVPQSEWRELNVALVGFGQTICKAPKPSCELCLLRDTCPYPKKNLK